MNFLSLCSALKKGWMAVSHSVGLIFSSILLTLLWLLGIGSYAVIFMVFNIFHRKTPSQTYWLPTPKNSTHDLEHPF